MSAVLYAGAFDAIAHEYDRRFTSTPHGARMRQQVWDLVDTLFLPGMRVLDIGCGTGADAVHLASRGVEIHGLDRSAGMIATARRILQATHTALPVTFEVTDVESWSPPKGVYWDGILSNFGVFNCISDHESLFARMATWLSPPGKLVLCLMGATAPAEWFWFGLQGRPDLALRRSRGYARIGEHRLAVRYLSLKALRSLCRDRFRITWHRSLGFLIPPEMEKGLERYPRTHRTLLLGERWLSTRFPCNRWGDHCLYLLQRIPGASS